MRTCLTAAQHLAGEGISVDVTDLRTLYPLDLDRYGGVAAEIAASLQEAAFDYLDAPILRVHAPDSPVPQSPALLDAYVPDSGKVEAAVRSLLARG